MLEDELFRYDKIQKFNETEIELYKYMISNAEKIPFMTIREIASDTKVSTSTILRFCSKIGCDSYKIFKNEFRKYVTEREKILPGVDLQQLFHYFQGTTTCAFEKKIQEGASLNSCFHWDGIFRSFGSLWSKIFLEFWNICNSVRRFIISSY